MGMRWLDRDYLGGYLSDDDADARLRSWTEARSALRGSETGAVAALAGSIYISDGVVESFAQHGEDRVDMALIIGDRQRGYERIHLRYTTACVLDDESPTLPDQLRHGSEIVVDELHKLDASTYEHCFILAGRGAFSVRFQQVQVTRAAVTSDERDALAASRRPL